MNNIETMKLALEALETNNKAWKSLADSGDAGWWEAEQQPFYDISVKAITALRQAIEQAQQADPIGASEETQRFAIQVEKLLCEKLGRKWSPSGISIQTLVDELADRKAQQAEPDYYGLTRDHLWMSITKDHHDRLKPEFRMACYTSPPPRQPLTDEEIQTVHDNVPDDYTDDSWVHAFARAIEAAHGIKG